MFCGKLLLAALCLLPLAAHADGDWLLVDDPLAAEIRPADGATVEQTPPDFSWPDVDPRARYTVTLTYPGGKVRSLPAPQNYINWDEVLPPGRYKWTVTAAGPASERTSQPRAFTVAPDAKPFLAPDMKALAARLKAKPHPRGLPDAATLALMAKQRPEGVQQLRNEVRYRMRKSPPAPMPDSRSPTNDNRRVYDEVKRTLNALPACALLGEDPYCTEAARRLRNLASWDPDGPTSYNRRGLNLAARTLTFALVLGYDWLHARLDPQDRRLLLKTIGARLGHMHADVIGERSRVAQRPRDSHGQLTATMLGMMAALVVGDLPQAEEWMQQALPLAINITQPWGGEDGGFSNGTAYGMWDTANLQSNWYVTRWATGIDFAQKAWVRNYARFLAYFNPPGTPAQLFGDGHEVAMFEEQSARFGKGYTHFAPTPLGRWYASRLSGESPLRFEYLMSPPADFSGPQPFPKGTPHSLYLPTTGWAAMHSDLADERRVSVYFKSSPPPHGAFNHQHADQNAFVINAGGERLAIESGYYDGWRSPHWRHWLHQTRAKNAITYDGGKGQIFFEQTGYKKMGYGRIVRFESTPHYDVVVGDATRAYDGALTEALRTLVYLRPGVLLVHDRLASAEPRRWEWNIHALQRMHETSERGIRIESNGQQLCVQMLAGAPVRFSQTDEWPAQAAPRRGEPQWHGRFETQPLRAAQLVALLDVGCKERAASATPAAQGAWTVRLGGKAIRLGPGGQISLEP
ncbi:MAG TPA: heparinase II/III family protein [Burkholderiales bacterium]